MRYEGYVYPNAEHGFNNDTTPRYDAATRELSVKRRWRFWTAAALKPPISAARLADRARTALDYLRTRPYRRLLNAKLHIVTLLIARAS